jgi:hypothetical protein
MPDSINARTFIGVDFSRKRFLLARGFYKSDFLYGSSRFIGSIWRIDREDLSKRAFPSFFLLLQIINYLPLYRLSWTSSFLFFFFFYIFFFLFARTIRKWYVRAVQSIVMFPFDKHETIKSMFCTKIYRIDNSKDMELFKNKVITQNTVLSNPAQTREEKQNQNIKTNSQYLSIRPW